MRTFNGQSFIFPLSIAATLIMALATLTTATATQADSSQISDGGQGCMCVLMKTNGGVESWGAYPSGALSNTQQTRAAGGKSFTRFYFDAVAKGDSRSSHFHTLVDSERAALNTLNPDNAVARHMPYPDDVGDEGVKMRATQ